MNFRFIYEPTFYSQVIFACMVDSRQSNPALANKIGDVIKRQVDLEVEKVTDNVLPYRIETEEGVLVSYLGLKVDKMGQNCTKLQLIIRVNYHSFTNDIETAVTNYINKNLWRPDFLI